MQEHQTHKGLTKRDYLEPAELAAFREFLQERARKRKSYRAATDYLLVEILSLAGLRAGEVAATVQHPDRYMRIRDLPLNPTDADPEIFLPETKGGPKQSVKVSTALRDRIIDYVNTFRTNAAPDAPLFESRNGTPLLYRTTYTKIRNLGIEAGLSKPLSPHMLRHSCAMDYLEKTGDIWGLKEHLRHAAINTTTVYLHTMNSKMRKNADLMK